MKFLSDFFVQTTCVLNRLFSTASNNLLMEDSHAHQVSFLER